MRLHVLSFFIEASYPGWPGEWRGRILSSVHRMENFSWLPGERGAILCFDLLFLWEFVEITWQLWGNHSPEHKNIIQKSFSISICSSCILILFIGAENRTFTRYFRFVPVTDWNVHIAKFSARLNRDSPPTHMKFLQKKYSRVCQDLGNRASPVYRPYMKRP